jgi:hypothetical protein
MQSTSAVGASALREASEMGETHAGAVTEGVTFARGERVSAATSAARAPDELPGDTQQAAIVDPAGTRFDDHGESLPQWLLDRAAQLDAPGEYICFKDGYEVVAVRLTRGWTRIGRALAADIRFEDPTVSRRHALLVHDGDGSRVLDDRSRNGVFVNGEIIEWSPLSHGDEIRVGRHRLYYVTLPSEAGARTAASEARDDARLLASCG